MQAPLTPYQNFLELLVAMLQLSQRPLLSTAADAALFVHRGRELATLHRAVRLGLNALLLGERGSGKTSLLHFFERTLRDDGTDVRFVEASSATTIDDLVELLLAAFPVSQDVRPDPGAVASSGLSVSAQLRRLGDAWDGGPLVLLVDTISKPGLVHALCGQQRDELWQLPFRWVVAGSSADRHAYLEPPSDLFFDLVIELDELSPEDAVELLVRRSTAPGATDDPAAKVLLGVATALGQRVTPRTPRQLLSAARTTLLADDDPTTVIQNLDALQIRAAGLGRPTAMVFTELLNLGPGQCLGSGPARASRLDPESGGAGAQAARTRRPRGLQDRGPWAGPAAQAVRRQPALPRGQEGWWGMSLELLAHLQREHAFDPTPLRENLGVYHVPFVELVGDAHPERTLLEACLRYERVALVGDSGAGKSSLTASVLGPLADGVAPVVVPVARETFEVVREPRAMFAHLASVIGAYARDAELLDEKGREAALRGVTAQRPVGRSGGRSGRFTIGWMGAQLGAELARQAGSAESIDRSATEALETVHQMVEIIRAESLAPVLVFDDTDRWFTGSAYVEPEPLFASFFGRVLPELFFGRVLPELVELRCALVVAVHRRYLEDPVTQTAVRRTLDTPVEVPPSERRRPLPRCSGPASARTPQRAHRCRSRTC